MAARTNRRAGDAAVWQTQSFPGGNASPTNSQKIVPRPHVRVDLNGDPAGAVTAGEAESARRAIAHIEARLAQRRQRRAAESKPAPTTIPEKPKRLTLADLKAAGAQRKLAAQGA